MTCYQRYKSVLADVKYYYQQDTDGETGHNVRVDYGNLVQGTDQC